MQNHKYSNLVYPLKIEKVLMDTTHLKPTIIIKQLHLLSRRMKLFKLMKIYKQGPTC